MQYKFKAKDSIGNEYIFGLFDIVGLDSDDTYFYIKNEPMRLLCKTIKLI